MVLITPGSATATEGEPVIETERVDIEEQWGVRVESIRSTAAGHMIDFRFRILDPEKATHLVDRRNKAYMIDEESGAVLAVPDTAKIGPLRQTVKYGKPKKDKIYLVIFSNPGNFIQPGKRVTVLIGDFRVENLVVE